MPTERNFKAIMRETDRASIRNSLTKLSGGNAVRVIREGEGYIEFTTTNPSYAILKILLLSPGSSVLERKADNMEADTTGELPKWIEEIVLCPNKNCITAQPKEPTKPKFRIVSTNPPKIQCYYCGRYIPSDNLAEQLS